MAMLLVVEFIPSMGESLDEALRSVQAGVDKGLGELGFARVRSHHSMTGRLACEKMCFDNAGNIVPPSDGAGIIGTASKRCGLVRGVVVQSGHLLLENGYRTEH
jgi:hypothetical protein